MPRLLVDTREKHPPDYWRDLASLRPVGDGSWQSQLGIFSWDRPDLPRHDEQTSYEAEFEAGLRLLVHGLDKPR